MRDVLGGSRARPRHRTHGFSSAAAFDRDHHRPRDVFFELGEYHSHGATPDRFTTMSQCSRSTTRQQRAPGPACDRPGTQHRAPERRRRDCSGRGPGVWLTSLRRPTCMREAWAQSGGDAAGEDVRAGMATRSVSRCAIGRRSQSGVDPWSRARWSCAAPRAVPAARPCLRPGPTWPTTRPRSPSVSRPRGRRGTPPMFAGQRRDRERGWRPADMRPPP